MELFIHLEAYAGAARAFDSYQVALAVFAERAAAGGDDGGAGGRRAAGELERLARGGVAFGPCPGPPLTMSSGARRATRCTPTRRSSASWR